MRQVNTQLSLHSITVKDNVNDVHKVCSFTRSQCLADSSYYNSLLLSLNP